MMESLDAIGDWKFPDGDLSDLNRRDLSPSLRQLLYEPIKPFKAKESFSTNFHQNDGSLNRKET